jgi:hypothetical protein
MAQHFFNIKFDISRKTIQIHNEDIIYNSSQLQSTLVVTIHYQIINHHFVVQILSLYVSIIRSYNAYH